MCGIAGFTSWGLDQTAADRVLGQMLSRLHHRGPDGEGRLVRPPVAVGMRRLGIIDLEGGAQPIWNEDHTVAVVFNGEIYNYIELRDQLSGHCFRTRSDTEVLVHLYEEYGESMCSQLRGMFGFCILDLRQNRLFLARDHFGQKPIYYHFSKEGFAFASELKCLLALDWVPQELRPEAFLDFITWMALPPPDTHFRHIQKLPAGSTLSLPLTPGGMPNVKTFWRYRLDQAPDLTDMEEAAAELDRVLNDSVKVHLRADVPVGVLLSSGLDSRCVSAYAQELHPGQLSTFSVGFPASKDSELEGAAQTAREIGSRHFELELRPEDFADSLDEIVWHLDEPIGDAAVFAVLRVCQLAREHVKVLLSGEGADELFAGYAPRYSGMLETMHRSESLRLLAGVVPRVSPTLHPSRWERFRDRVHLSPAEEQVRLRREGFPGDIRHPRGLTEAQLGRLRQREQELAAALFRPQRDRLSELLAFDIDWQLAESLLQKADKMSMGASVELRTPFLDAEVARLAARIPSGLKLPEGGPGKYVLRRCLARKLNEDHDRPKRGFPVPLGSWFSGILRPRIEEEVFGSNACWEAHLDRQRVRGAWEDVLAGRWDGARVFYALWIYERWRAALKDGFSEKSPLDSMAL